MLPGLFFLPAIKRQKFNQATQRAYYLVKYMSCILEAVPIYQHTAVLTAHSEKTRAPQVFLQALHVYCPVFWTPALVDNVQVSLRFTHNLF